MEILKALRTQDQNATNKAPGRKTTASLPLFLGMKDTAVEHVLATESEVSWANSCWNKQ